MAIFERFAQYLESYSFQIVVFDMAPTGHTLRLLDLPFDYAKQVDLMVAGSEAGGIQRQAVSNRYQELIRQLRDKDHSVFCLVLYPESTPILESYRAMQDLREAGIETQLAIANRLLPEEACSNDFGRRRRQMQERRLEEIERRFQLPLLTFPLLSEEIYGLAKLEAALVYFPQAAGELQQGNTSSINPLRLDQGISTSISSPE
jgi:arsenite-transporting ATPase